MKNQNEYYISGYVPIHGFLITPLSDRAVTYLDIKEVITDASPLCHINSSSTVHGSKHKL
jgi:hypothetical protein